MNLIEWVVGNMHVSTTRTEIVREFYRRYKKVGLHKRDSRRARRKVYKIALKAHKRNFDLYRRVMNGV